MNKIEYFIYNRLKQNPKIKLYIRNIYQNFFDLIPKKPDFFCNITYIRENYFFGFHDITPFSKNNEYILANRLTIPLRMPKPGDKLIVGYFKDIGLNKYESIDETDAWNYHKGCRLQWLISGKQIIYNHHNRARDEVRARYYDIQKNKYYNLEFPIDTVSPNGKLFTSFSYSRLNKYMPGYGYEFKDYSDINSYHPEDSGIIINDKKNILKFKLSLSVIIINLEDERIHISPTREMFSHYVWNPNGSIIAYCRINGIDSHVLFKDFTMQEYIRVAYPILNSDGHQTFSNDPKKFIVDTYPDKKRTARLYEVNIGQNTTKLLASIRSPKVFQSPDYTKNHWACDLHPRLSPDGNYVSFDSVHTGKRAFCIMQIFNE